MSKYSSDKEMKKLFEGFRKIIKEQDLFDGETGKPLSPKAIGIMKKNMRDRYGKQVIVPILQLIEKLSKQYGRVFDIILQQVLENADDAGNYDIIYGLFIAATDTTDSAQKPKFKPDIEFPSDSMDKPDIEFPSDSRDKSSQPKQPETSKGGGSSVPEGVKKAIQQLNSMIKSAQDSGNTEMVNRLKQRKMELVNDHLNSLKKK